METTVKKHLYARNRSSLATEKGTSGMGKINLSRLFAHGYMICSIVGIALLYFAYDIAMWFLGIGAASTYISIGMFLTANVSRFWIICAFLWSLLFPIYLIVSYIIALKERYQMLVIAVVLDTLVTILFLVHTLLTENWYGLHLAIVDVITNLVVLLLFLRILRKAEDNSAP